jgi:glycosyltransferase involved in cell wall biosynthesis
MKWLHLLRSRRKTVALIDNETLYFLREQRYSRIVSLALKKLLGTYDALICVGEMETQLAKEILGAKCPPTYKVIHGVPEARRRGLGATRPRLEGSDIMFCAHGPGGWRLWYKGLDVMLRAFWMSREQSPGLRLYVVGEWDRSGVEELLAPRRLEEREAVVFTGRQDCLEEWFARSALYLHCGRGDAYAITVLEAMCAGVVPIVSEWTGAREVVARVSGDLVVPLDAEAISQRILWYFTLDDAGRRGLSGRCREIISEFTEDAADRRFEEAFGRMAKDLGVEWIAPRWSIAQ